ncbi:peptidoglycan recognition protein family protein [Enterovirga rhinocerotis]|uniref:N-acetylmuramoyl-L-alanine amidase n=1 Tax=Enterovirga rhinocerotis TaxID=1339210 RepID=A0A4R7C1A7_9HYPH|nr:N-acetylmuramoyl-L-alanine amidase [Enterovirga rhinocerotis]TDR90277.1 N-acetylmuramoyl-L-alanine amidase [Enterovirga rhinocerotis]
MIVLDIQRRLKALGYDIGRSGPNKDGIDGDLGDLSQTAILKALETGKPALAGIVLPVVPPVAPAVGVVPSAWMPAAKMARVIVHWTAGAHKASDLDREHYHVIIQGDGTLARGKSIALNDGAGIKSGYAAHTLNLNTGSIGVSLACMAGAIERPFDPGKAPMTPKQWDMLPGVLAGLCSRYGIPVTPRTVLSHAEVQGTLGIAQRGKWDIAAVPSAGSMIYVGATGAGNTIRAATSALLNPALAA